MLTAGTMPFPNGELRNGAGEFSFVDGFPRIDRGGFGAHCTAAFEARLRGRGIAADGGGGSAARFLLERDPSFGPEAYRLEVLPGSISVTAGGEGGIIQGLTTLYTALGAGSVSCGIVNDEPRYRHRGFMLDCVRHFFDRAEVERIIEQMSLVKLNVFHWHLSDDQGWRIESNAFPELNALPGGRYSRDDIRQVVAFARERGVEVIPEIDLPGHTTAILSAFPGLSCRGEKLSPAEAGGIYKIILCAGKEETYSFLYRLLDETAELFDSPYFHLGGDEAPKDEWEQCEHCKGMIAREGLAGFGDLQAHFTARLAAHLAEKGKRVVCWNDVLHAETPPPADIQYWVDWTGGAEMRKFHDGGGRVVFSDMFSLYLDYPECFSSLEKVYGYEPHLGDSSRASAPNTAGIEACIWTERLDSPEALERKIFPRLFALAEAAWTRDRDYADFEERLGAKLAALEKEGIAFLPLERCNPKGAARAAEIAEFWQAMQAAMGGSSLPDPAMLERMVAMLVQGFDLGSLPVSV